MKTTKLQFLAATAACVLTTCMVTRAADKFTADWESLKQREPAPEWFRDAKFGIYFHWGVYSVPAFGSEWYPRNMHLAGRRENKHHIETYGDPTEFGYHDFVPKFRAERFDPDEWAELFEKAGARFAGPVCEHHDGFAMWASKVTPWNAGDMGPKRDLTGELEKAVRARDMRFVATFHHARNSLWEKRGKGQWSGHYDGAKNNYPSLLDDPKNAVLYGYMPREKFLDMWKAKLIEAGGGKLAGKPPVTGDWEKFETVAIGTIEVGEAGKQVVKIGRDPGAEWKAINMTFLELKAQ